MGNHLALAYHLTIVRKPRYCNSWFTGGFAHQWPERRPLGVRQHTKYIKQCFNKTLYGDFY